MDPLMAHILAFLLASLAISSVKYDLKQKKTARNSKK